MPQIKKSDKASTQKENVPVSPEPEAASASPATAATVSASPTPDSGAATVAAPAKSGSKTGLIIIVVVLLLLCCCGSVAAVGYYFYRRGAELLLTITPTVSVKPTVSSTQPDINDVVSDFGNVDSYRIYSINQQQDYSINGEYLSPNREYARSSDGDEEILMGNKVYVKLSGEDWTLGDEPSLTGFHNLFLDNVFAVMADDGTAKGEKDGYWLYEEGDPDTARGSVELYVNKETGLPEIVRLIIEGEESLYVEFSDYNATDIDITAPI